MTKILNYIYGLRDPRNDTYRYIGKTSVGSKRPLSHLIHSHNESVNVWIKDLKSLGLVPIVDIIEEVDDINDLMDRERFYIYYYSDKQAMLLNGNRDTYCSVNSQITMSQSLINDLFFFMKNIGEIYKLVKTSTNFSDELLANMFGVGRKVLYSVKQSDTKVSYSTYLKLVFLATVKLDGLFDYYYKKTNEFKGDYPDNKNQFISRCLTDYGFSKYWFNRMYVEECNLSKINYNKRAPKRNIKTK